MNEEIEKFEVRDFRRKEFFQVDDAYLNGFARLCGIYATGVYLSLCRHANKSQTSFPSVKLISEELAISEDSVTKAIKILTEHKIIQYERKRTNFGVFLSTVYVLLDKKHWTTATHSAVSDMDTHSVDSGMDRGYTHSAVSGTKYTQRLKDTQEKKIKKENSFIEEARRVLEHWNKIYKTQFKSPIAIIDNLLYWRNSYSLEEIFHAITNIQYDDYWLDKMTPVMLLRQKNPNKERVDYISIFLNGKEPKSMFTPEEKLGLQMAEEYLRKKNQI